MSRVDELLVLLVSIFCSYGTAHNDIEETRHGGGS